MGQCQEEALSLLKDTINVTTKSSIMKRLRTGWGEGVLMENTDKDNHALVKGNPERIHLI